MRMQPVQAQGPGLVTSMAVHALRRYNLPQPGSRGVVPEILFDKRGLNARQCRALAYRLGIECGEPPPRKSALGV
jgi:hypothetical protein